STPTLKCRALKCRTSCWPEWRAVPGPSRSRADMRAGTDPIIVGLITQAVAIAIVAILSLLLTRSTRRPYLRYWTGAWICLCVALAALLGSLLLARVGLLLQPLYLLGEYLFGFLF